MTDPPLWRRLTPTLVIVALAYVPLLLSEPGRISADTKTHLYTDPAELMARAWSLWDPNIGLGTVTHQNISFLFPIGPWYWFFDVIGAPDWIAQRLWMGTILVAAGLGARALSRSLGASELGSTVAGAAFMLSPYAMAYGARLSVIAMPWAAAPWLILFARRAVLRGGWREPAWFAVVVAITGTVNITSLILAGLAPLVWVISLVVRRLATLGATVAACIRMGVLSVAVSLWWFIALLVQGAYGIDILRYSETAETVANASLASEVWRGMGYWFLYGDDRLGQWVEPGRALMQNPIVIAASFAVPVVGLIAAVILRWRPRATLIALIVTGLVVAVGAHPWDSPTPVGRLFKAMLETDTGLAMRSLPRAAPLVVLGLSVLTAALLTAIARQRPSWHRPAAAVIAVLVLVTAMPGLADGWVDDNLSRPEDIPDYWMDAAEHLDATDDGTRVLEVPGIDFASYRWGSTVDPILSGAMQRPVAYRELIPFGSDPSTNLLLAYDRRMQDGIIEPEAIAPVARVMRAGSILLRNDLQFERYRTPRPRWISPLFESAPGLGEPVDFGVGVPNEPDPEIPMLDDLELALDPSIPEPPALQVFTVEGARQIVDRLPTASPVVLSGDGDGIVDAASAGLIDGNEAIFYSGALHGEGDILDDLLADEALLVVTDSNRLRAYRWSGVRENTGFTEPIGFVPLVPDGRDNRLDLFPEAPISESTVLEARGGIWARATTYGNEISYTPEYRPAAAIDGLLSSAWLAAPGGSIDGQRLVIEMDDPVTTDSIGVVQPSVGVNRFLTDVAIRLDGGPPILVELDESSHSAPGQRITFPEQTFETVEIELLDTDEQFGSPVGFAEVDIEGRTAGEVIVMPSALLTASGDASLDHPLALVMTRLRVHPSEAARRDEERYLDRAIELPTSRAFRLAGTSHLSENAPDDVVDRALGFPSADEGGVTATSSRRLYGDFLARASSSIDGDTSTWWSPPFDGIEGDWMDFVLSEPVTVERMELAVVADGRHSVPTRLRLENEAGEVRVVDVPAIEDVDQPNGTASVTIEVPALRAERLRVTVEEIRETTTIDWYSQDELPTPVGIAELGIDGLERAAGPGTIDDACRDDLVVVEGRSIPVRLVGDAEEALRWGSISVSPCEASDEVAVEAGELRVTTTPGETTGYEIDQLRFTSEAGGAAATLPAGGADPVPLEVTSEGRARIEAEAGPSDEDTWLLVGQSWNPGWHATVDGEDLGPPQLLNGFANGWRLPASEDTREIVFEWTPQRPVTMGLVLSGALVPAVFLLAVFGRRRPESAAEAVDPPDLALARVRDRGPVPLPRGRALRLAALVSLVGVLFVGVVPAAIALVVLVASIFVPRGRALLTLAVPGLLALLGLDIVQLQLRYALRPGFLWLEWFDRSHYMGLATGLLLVAHLLIENAVERLGERDDERDADEPVEVQG